MTDSHSTAELVERTAGQLEQAYGPSTADEFRAEAAALLDCLQQQDRLSQWQPIETAPRDGSPVILLLRDDIYPVLRPEREDLKPWNGIAAVMRSRGDVSAWCFAAPVGQGGFPDEWMVGWQPLPETPRTHSIGQLQSGNE
jgi:hypothetical protein